MYQLRILLIYSRALYTNENDCVDFNDCSTFINFLFAGIVQIPSFYLKVSWKNEQLNRHNVRLMNILLVIHTEFYKYSIQLNGPM